MGKDSYKLLEEFLSGGLEKEVNPNESFIVGRGTSIIFGRNPLTSPDFPYGHGVRAVRLASGVGKNQLSRAAVRLGIENTGKVWMMCMTTSNAVTLYQKESFEGGEELVETVIRAIDPWPRFIRPDAVIEIQTADGTRIRLQSDPETAKVPENARLIHAYKVLVNPKDIVE